MNFYLPLSIKNKKMSCHFVFKNGKQCTNNKLDYSNFCHLLAHHPSQEEYDFCYELNLNNFTNERELASNYTVIDVEGDGACLFRCLSNCIFINSSRDLNLVIEKFEETGCFDYPNFLDDFIEIADCFTADDYVLDNDLEEQIARGIQSMILNYVRKNAKMKVMMDMSLEDLIQLCHEINIEDYLNNYSRFAGDNDFVIEQVEGKDKKIPIDDRWGGIPELKVFCLLFNFNISIYVPQEFNQKNMKADNVTKIDEDTYLKLIEKIESNQDNPKEFKLLLRYYKKGSHYDYIVNYNYKK